MTQCAASIADASPVSSVQYFAADKTAPYLAREATRNFLTDRATSDEIYTAALLVSEMVTNSVTAYGGIDKARVSLSLRIVDTQLFARIIDSAPGYPEFSEPDLGDVHGYGLFLVKEFSQRHGWFLMNGGRKCTYFLLYLSGGMEGGKK